MPILKIKQGDEWLKVTIDKPVFRIGRAIGNDYIVHSLRVSRAHCEIKLEGNHHVVYDLDSSLGMSVNGRRVKHAILNDGDNIYLANLIEMVFHEEDVDITRKIKNVGEIVSLFDDRLISVNGPLAGQVFPLSKQVTRVGRNLSNDIAISADTISRVHAEFRREGAEIVLYDLGSGNGCYVGEDKVDQRVLRHGDMVRFDQYNFRYEARKDPVETSLAGIISDTETIQPQQLFTALLDNSDGPTQQMEHVKEPGAKTLDKGDEEIMDAVKEEGAKGGGRFSLLLVLVLIALGGAYFLLF